MNRHSRCLGNDLLTANGQRVRGQRVFCSNRGRRGGCGRTFALVLAEVLPRHTVTAPLLWRWLVSWLAGLSLKAGTTGRENMHPVYATTMAALTLQVYYRFLPTYQPIEEQAVEPQSDGDVKILVL